MERWASISKFAGKVNFLMVCVGEQGLAYTFHKRYQLKKSLNGYIENQFEMPRFGQLGCQGFIIFDQNAKMVLPKSAKYLDVHDRAFEDVEFQLETLLSKGELNLLKENQRVELTRLRLGSLNGNFATIVDFDPEVKRYEVKIDGQSRTHRVKPVNIIPFGGSVEPTLKKQKKSSSKGA
mmetsp:Transcript_10970/g.16387  ORF Transcript_10970/g.16387 Transcript_10970/m.16387 type:complete len:179 (+) Transcript_10970:196-732(+)